MSRPTPHLESIAGDNATVSTDLMPDAAMHSGALVMHRERRLAWLVQLVPAMAVVVLPGAMAGFLAVQHVWIAAAVLAGAAVFAALALLPARRRDGADGGTRALLRHPELLAERRRSQLEELAVLESAQDAQRSVFEVASELVGCVDEADARERFGATMRAYFSCKGVDLLVWERGRWRSLGGPALGGEPTLTAPVQLPAETGGDLIIDLTPGVAGQAALVLRGAAPQPSIADRSEADQRYIAEVLRGQLALSLRRVMLYQDLRRLGRMDPLTGTHRRWYGERRLKELVDGRHVVSVAIADIDHFKKVNDQHGHAAGDAVLAAVGRKLVAALRGGDLVARYGGEEFLLVLPDAIPDGAAIVAERLRVAVAGLTGLPSAVTISIGLASCHHDDTPEDLIARADAALYRAKGEGRNRVVQAETAETLVRVRTTIKRPRSALEKRTASGGHPVQRSSASGAHYVVSGIAADLQSASGPQAAIPNPPPMPGAADLNVATPLPGAVQVSPGALTRKPPTAPSLSTVTAPPATAVTSSFAPTAASDAVTGAVAAPSVTTPTAPTARSTDAPPQRRRSTTSASSDGPTIDIAPIDLSEVQLDPETLSVPMDEVVPLSTRTARRFIQDQSDARAAAVDGGVRTTPADSAAPAPDAPAPPTEAPTTTPAPPDVPPT